VDRHQLDADPDPSFHVATVPDPDPDWLQNGADPHEDPTLNFAHVEKSEYFFFVTALPV
jgi:hypothetical protein